MEVSEPKWVNSDVIQDGVNSLKLGWNLTKLNNIKFHKL